MKLNYLNSLEREFYFVDDEERTQIIEEYAVHFEERTKEGATEAEVIADLGSPRVVAIEYASELGINYSTSEKHLSNFKRDCNLYLKSIKTKMNDIKNEEAAKRANRKQYTKEKVIVDATIDNEEQTEHQSHQGQTARNHALIGKTWTKLIKLLKQMSKLIFSLVYLIRVMIIYFFKICYSFCAIIIGITFGLGALALITIGVLLPLFIDISLELGSKLIVWLIIYGAIISLLVLFVTICISCLKQFGSKIHE